MAGITNERSQIPLAKRLGFLRIEERADPLLAPPRLQGETKIRVSGTVHGLVEGGRRRWIEQTGGFRGRRGILSQTKGGVQEERSNDAEKLYR